MPVFRKNRKELKKFRSYQYRKKPWLSWNGKMFWQTTIVGCTAVVTIILWICFGMAGYWLETVYQVWCIAFPVAPVLSFCNWSFWKIWLKTVYRKENCRRYLFPLCICILSFGWILVIIYLLYHLFGLLYFCYLITEGGGLGID